MEIVIRGRIARLEPERRHRIVYASHRGVQRAMYEVLFQPLLLKLSKRLVMRAARRNVLLRFREVSGSFEDPSTGARESKTVFVAFVQGQRTHSKVVQLVDAFDGVLFPAGNPVALRKQMEESYDGVLVTSRGTDAQIRALLTEINVCIRSWKRGLLSCLVVFGQSGKIRMQGQTAVMESWIPTAKLSAIENALQCAREEGGSDIPPICETMATDPADVVPTYFETNEYTGAFHTLVASYGTARYQEVNPAAISIVSFPFLFGVMYGDIGHGFLLLLLGLGLVLLGKRKGRDAGRDMGEIGGLLFGGRYLIIAMALFAIWMGALYNDCFGMSLQLTGTSKYYQLPLGTDTKQLIKTGGTAAYQPSLSATVCPFGLDPTWGYASNKLETMNSLKMKMSIILGVSHMICGLCLQTLNHLYFKGKLLYIYVFCLCELLMSLFFPLRILVTRRFLTTEALIV